MIATSVESLQSFVEMQSTWALGYGSMRAHATVLASGTRLLGTLCGIRRAAEVT